MHFMHKRRLLDLLWKNAWSYRLHVQKMHKKWSLSLSSCLVNLSNNTSKLLHQVVTSWHQNYCTRLWRHDIKTTVPGCDVMTSKLLYRTDASSIQGELYDRKKTHDKWTYNWWQRPIRRRLLSLQDWYNRMKLFSDNRKDEYEFFNYMV